MHHIIAVQKIPADLDKVWELFSIPSNIVEVTPPNMKVRVLSVSQSDRVFAGQVIEYRVRPLFGISMYWKTEITEVRGHEFFSDEQRKGPYLVWQHEHHFKKIEGGVEMTDLVEYKNRLGWTGRLINNILLRKKLKKLFEYRFQKVEELLGKWEGQVPQITVT